MTLSPDTNGLWPWDRLRSKQGLVLSSCLLFLAVVFSADPFGVVPDTFFRKSLGAQEVGRIDPLSESLVYGRAIKANSEDGIGFAESLGNYHRPGLSWPAKTVLHERMVRDELAPDTQDKWVPYTSEFGLQGMVFTTLLSISPFNASTTLDLIRILCALALALSLTHLIYWSAAQFGYAIAPFLALFFGFSPWLVAFADSPYWVLFLSFLPLNISLYFLSKEDGGPPASPYAFTGWLFAAFFIKALCGYTYFSAVVAASAIPIIFYWAIGKLSPQQVIIKSGGVAVAGVAGFVLSFIALSLRNGVYDGLSFAQAFANNINMTLRRTLASGDDSAGLGANFSMEPAERTRNSLDAPITEVVQVYWTQDIFVGIPFWAFAAICVGAGILIIATKEIFPGIAARRKKLAALYSAFLISICAPLTWYVLAKAHAYIHTFWAMVIWYVPTMFFAALFMLVLARLVVSDAAAHLRSVSFNKNLKNAHATLAAVIVAVIAVATWAVFNASQAQIKERTGNALSEGQKYKLAKGWEAVIHEDWIYIIAKQCPLISDKTFIRVEVTGSGANGRTASQNLDFRWQQQTVRVPKRHERDNRCVARRLLPDAKIRSIAIAEDSPLYGVLWTAEIRLQ